MNITRDNNQPMRPPSRHRVNLLPFEDLYPEEFELASQDIALLSYKDTHRVELKRKRGQKQFEVDVECFDVDQEPEIVIQCKRYASVSASEITDWVAKFIEELSGHWKERRVKKYILAITVEGNDDKLNEAFRKAAKLLKEHDIEFEPWTLKKLTDVISTSEDLVDRYFGRYYVDAISAGDLTEKSNTSISNDLVSAGISSSLSVVSLANQLTASVEQNLDLLEQEAKGGRPTALERYLAEQRNVSTNWESLAPSTKARILRRLMLIAVDKGELPEAEKLFAESCALAAPKDKTGEAFLIRLRDSTQSAIDFLAGTSIDAEKEVLASFQITAGKLTDAEKTLSKVSSPECERLLALIAMRQGKSADAIKHAEEAVKLRSNSFGTHLALLLAHAQAALISGVAVEMNFEPNPFNPIIVRKDSEARGHLEEALGIANHLILNTEGRLKHALETWKLALLISHPEKRLEVASYIEEVIGGGQPTPTFIAWALFIGYRLKVGKLRKYLEDRARSTDGEPTDVVVAALLVRENKTPHDAGKLIEKYLGKWETADSFLKDWQGRILGAPDLLVQVDNGSSDDFDSLVADALREPISPEAILVSADVLRKRRAYRQVLALKEKLLEIANADAIEILAEALIEQGAPDEALSLISTNIQVFGNGSLPSRVVRLQTIATDRSGKSGATLAMLERLDEAEPSLENKVNIVQRAYALNDSDRVIRYAKAIAESDENPSGERLIAAQAVSDFDPGLARTLISNYIKHDAPDPASLGIVWKLIGKLGLDDLSRSQEFQELQRAALSHESVIKFDNVEQVFEYVNKQNQELRESRRPWLLGQLPTHVAFRSDFTAFAEIYLSPHRKITTDIGDTYPRISTAAGLPPKPMPSLAVNDKPEIVVDISALLTIGQHQLETALSESFRCVVPPSVPIALQDIIESLESSLPGLEDDVVTFLELHKNQVEQLAEDHDGGSLLRRNLGDGEAEKQLSEFFHDISEVIEPAEQDIEGLRTWLGAQKGIRPTASNTYYVEGAILVGLVRFGVFTEAIQSGTVKTTSKELEHLYRAVERQKTLTQHVQTVQRVLAFVQEKLRRDEWTELRISNTVVDEQTHAPPIIASLSHCLSGIPEKQDRWFAIEDRFVQRHRFPNVMSFSELLDLFRAANAIDERTYVRVQNGRYDIGVGMLPINITRIVDVLGAAKFDESGLVENIRTQRERRAFCNQLDLLKFADWTERREDNGRIIGEPRHTMDLAFLVVDLLNEIWSSNAFSEDNLQQVSEWVWRTFRVEIVPRFDADADNRSRFISSYIMLLVKLVSVPFFDRAASERERQWASYQKYIDWVFGHVILPRFTASPDLQDIFVREFVRIFRSHLHSEQDLAEGIDPQTLKSYYVREFQELIDLFPDSIKDELLGWDGFASNLGIVREFSISLDAGKISASNLEAAIGQSLDNGGKPTKVETLDGNEYQLSVSMSGKDDLSDVTLEYADGSKVKLSTETATTTAPKPELRLKLFEKLTELHQSTPQVVDAIRSALSEDSSVDQRLKKYYNARNRDFRFSEVRLHNILDNHDELNTSSFDLPSAEAMANYLRVDMGGKSPELSALSAGYATLASDIDAETADRRFGGCPYQIVREPAYSQSLPTRGDSIFQFVGALENLTGEESEDGLAAQWQRILEVYDRQIDLFVTLVKRGTHQALARPDWKSLSPEFLISFVWVWAERTSAAFVARHIDTEQIANWLSKQNRYSVASMLWDFDTEKLDPNLGFEASKSSVSQILLGIAKPALGNLSDADKRRVLQWIGSIDEDLWLPHPSMLLESQENKLQLRNKLVLSDELFADFSEVSKHVADFQLSSIYTDMLDKARGSEKPPEHLFLLGVIEAVDVPSDVREQIWQILSAYFEVEQPRLDENGQKFAFRFFSSLAGFLDRKEAFDKAWKAQVRARIQADDDQNPVSANDECYAAVVDGFARFVGAGPSSLDIKVQQLLALLSELGSIWPQSRMETLNLMSNFHSNLPSEIAANNWGAFEEFRRDAA